MGDNLKFITEELNKPPFNKKYTAITFDALDGRTLFNILLDVLNEIDYSEKKVDVEDHGAALSYILSSLSIFNYSIPRDNLEKLQKDILDGEKIVICSLLEWLLKRIPELKTRSYLSKFLVKLDVPQEFLIDIEVSEMYTHYLDLIEQFKECHKESEHLKSLSASTSEIKHDIENMDDEKRQLTKRLERVKKKVEYIQNLDDILAEAKSLHQEREREETLNIQMQQLHTAISHDEQRLQRISRSVEEVKQSQHDLSPENLIERLEQELKVNMYIAVEQLPKELKEYQLVISDLHKVEQNEMMKKTDLDLLIEKINSLNNSITKLVEKRTVISDPMDDKLSLFRQQAAIIAHKKESNAEAVNELRNKLRNLEKMVMEKKKHIEQLGGIEILKGDEFKNYVNMLRGKSTIYKMNRQKQTDLQAEMGVLSRTEEILKQKYEDVEKALSDLEAESGITGFRKVQENLETVSSTKSEVDEEKANTLTAISSIVMQLNKSIQEKKAALAPIIKELQPVRQNFQDLNVVYEQKKSTYNTVAAGLEVASKKLEKEVTSLGAQCNSQESRKYFLEANLNIIQVQLDQAANEMKNYLSSTPSVKRLLLREQLNQYIQEQEKRGKLLKEEQKYIQSSHNAKIEQMLMWKNLKQLFDSKLHCIAKLNV